MACFYNLLDKSILVQDAGYQQPKNTAIKVSFLNAFFIMMPRS